MPIPPASHPRKRRAVNAATAVASRSSSQMESSRAVADTRDTEKFDGRVSQAWMMPKEKREKRIQKFESTEHQKTNIAHHLA